MKQTLGFKESISLLEDNHDMLLQRTERFYDALSHLRYEGKVHLGKNRENVGEILRFFQEKLIPHIQLEDILFSYIEIHIPKLESVIRILKAEHKEIKLNLEVLQFLLWEIAEEKSEAKRMQIAEKLKDKGIYLIYLMRNHIQVEDESIYKSINQELRSAEKKEILKRFKECQEQLSQHNSEGKIPCSGAPVFGE